METFFGGQIKEECRGNFSVIVSKGEVPKRYDLFMYTMDSEEFIYLTGARVAKYPFDRAYLGVSHDAGEKVIAGLVDKNPAEVDLRSIDKLVVASYFLDKNSNKSDTIILKSTSDGYEVIRVK